MPPLSCLHVVPSLASTYGGPAVAVPALCEALTGLDVSVKLCAAEDEAFAGRSVDVPASVPVVRYGLGGNWAARRFLRGELPSVLGHMALSSMVIHSHGVWRPESYFAARTAARLKQPHIVSSRGMLEPWALRQRYLKKKIGLMLYQRRVLENASVLHATSPEEALSQRRLGLRNPIAVIPNGVKLEVRSKDECRETVDTLWPELRGKRLLVFHSRLHRKKGLNELLSVWPQIAPRFPDWVLVVSGNDEENFIGRYSLQPHISPETKTIYLGHVPNDIGQQLLGRASLMALPSYTENFGNVIAESLAHGTPVLTTTNTPWESINQYDAGLCIPGNSEDDIRAALMNLCSRPEQELLRMGSNGRLWVERSYSWRSAARQLRDVYQWVLGRGPRPACVWVEKDGRASALQQQYTPA
jgi:glycosyltransferase involved in cell wall biosynthesis